jgi:hypothetical protein
VNRERDKQAVRDRRDSKAGVRSTEHFSLQAASSVLLFSRVSLHRPELMIVLSPSTPMMIKKKTKDTTRKNVARSSVIMMTHPVCSSSALERAVEHVSLHHSVSESDCYTATNRPEIVHAVGLT